MYTVPTNHSFHKHIIKFKAVHYEVPIYIRFLLVVLYNHNNIAKSIIHMDVLDTSSDQDLCTFLQRFVPQFQM